MAPPGGIWTLWSECKDKDPRGPEALWKLVPNGDTVLIQEQHFNDLEPGVSPQCLLNTKPYRPDRDALVQLGDCDAKAANQQWKVQFDSAGKPQIIGTYGKYKGQCLVQTQDPAYKQESVGDYSGVFNYLPCGDKTKAKGAITPPATALELVDATDAKFVPAFETIQQDKLGKYEDPVCARTRKSALHDILKQLRRTISVQISEQSTVTTLLILLPLYSIWPLC
jgi:hypothetical protein